MKSKLTTAAVATIILATVTAAMAQDASDWPRTIDTPKGKIIIYQPQLESFENDQLKARAAVCVSLADKPDDRIFGAVWVACRTSTDRDARIVHMTELKVTDAKFPNATDDQIAKLKDAIENGASAWNLTIPLDHLLASVKALDKQQKNAGKLNNNPPKIIFSIEPAVLVVMDGQAKMQKAGDTPLMRIVNTPYFIVLDMDSKTYFLKADNYWMKADKLDGQWQVATSVPSAAVALADNKDTAGQAGQADVAGPAADTVVPKIIVATEPTELIVVNGQPEYQTISGTDLLYVSNTDRDVFLDIDNQNIYILLSGRWFTAKKKDGPWMYVAGKDLPADFAKISPDGPKGNVRASVPGTDEAKEAVAESYIPQTAAVKRSDAKLTVTYDGEAKFVPIEGTAMQYAVNTEDSVILVGAKYYCCRDAVWFVADAAIGPWVICTAVPQEIYTIPPECPVYPVQYVYVYDSTPEVVYVGYTPGYEECYVYEGCVVYGTGYVYPPWFGAFYYPRPVTWGFGFYYNSGSGRWGVVVDHNGNWFFAGGRWCGGYVTGGWWGHGGFCGNNININRSVNINNININKNEINNIRAQANNIYNRRNDVVPRPNRDNPYNGPHDKGLLPPDKAGLDKPRADNLGQNRNNVLADKDGNVYRKDLDGWQTHSAGDWKPAKQPDVQPKPDNPQPRQNYQQDLDRDFQARNRGNERYQQYQRPSTPSRSYGGGGRGGRR